MTSSASKQVFVAGALDDLRLRQVRALHEASKLGKVTVLLWDDKAVQRLTNTAPKFPLAERKYMVESIRYVARVEVVSASEAADVPPGSIWIAEEGSIAPKNVDLRVLEESLLAQVPAPPACPINPPSKSGKKVVVTGCFDWLHSGHVRFFEEVAQLGDLYVIVGHDRNIRLLKGEGHPLFPEAQRRYMAGAFRQVTMALVSSGDGWLDGEPEFRKLKPDIYAVNEDGDKPEKQRFCEENGIEYKVLRRLPKEGLQERQSTKLRGF